MPATKEKNLRSGDIAEQLGLVLLQSLVLTAPIPRTEDVGIDAVATLIKDYDSYNYLAEDSFFVQIKSSSITEIRLDEKQTKWLNALELPFFVGQVDRKKSEISLFCAHRLSHALITNYERNELIIHLNDKNITDEIVEKDDVNVHIGPPILKWDLNSLHENAFLDRAYNILKAHITIYKNNLETRRIGVATLLNWKTNQNPKVYGQVSTSSKGGNKDLEETYDLMMPYFVKWLGELLFAEDFSPANDILKLLEKAKKVIEARKNNR